MLKVQSDVRGIRTGVFKWSGCGMVVEMAQFKVKSKNAVYIFRK